MWGGEYAYPQQLHLSQAPQSDTPILRPAVGIAILACFGSKLQTDMWQILLIHQLAKIGSLGGFACRPVVARRADADADSIRLPPTLFPAAARYYHVDLEEDEEETRDTWFEWLPSLVSRGTWMKGIQPRILTSDLP